MTLPPLPLPGLAQRWISYVFEAFFKVLETRVRLSDKGAGAGVSPASRLQNIALHQKVMRMWRQFDGVVARALAGKLQVRGTLSAPEGEETGSGEASSEKTDSDNAGSSEAGPGEPDAGEQKNAAARTKPQPKPGGGPKPCWFGEHWIMATHPSAMPAYPTRGFGWMRKFIPAYEQTYFLRRLTEPSVVLELTTLCHVSSTVARIIRSLCHGMGVVAPAGMLPRPKKRKSRARPKSEHKTRRPYVTPDDRPMTKYMLRKLEIVVPPGYRDRQWVKIRAEQKAQAAAQGSTDGAPAGVRPAKR